MNVCRFFLSLLTLFVLSNVVLGIPLDNLHQNEDLSIESSKSSVSPYTSLAKENSLSPSLTNKTSSDALFKLPLSQETLMTGEKRTHGASEDKQIIAHDDKEYYLFELEELDAHKPGLEIYQTLVPLFSSEMKKDVKKVWAESADFREAIDSAMKDSGSRELILHQSTQEMTLLKGKTLEKISNNNLPPGVYDKQEPDKTVVRVLFDDFYDLLKNAFLIIVIVLILGKIISFIVKKVIAGSERRKKRQARRHRKKHRKKRRRSYA